MLIQLLLGKIVALNLEVNIEPTALADIASVLRGNARAAQKMAQKIESYCEQNNTKAFKLKDWNKLGKILSIYPLGLNITEILLLNILINVKIFDK